MAWIDRKYLAKIFLLDNKFDAIDNSIIKLNEGIEDNTQRIIKLESDFKNHKENIPEKIENIFNKNFDAKQNLWLKSQSENKQLPK